MSLDLRLTRRALLGAAPAAFPAIVRSQAARRPNILFAISDDMSFPHTGAAGDPVVKTPGFDRVAERGILFRHAVCASPGCAPSRASILTGKHHWQLREAGTHSSYFPRDLTVYPDLLAKAGYHVGLTGKGAGPCNFRDKGWPNNPAGPSYDTHKLANPRKGMNANDYAANFAEFLRKRPAGAPFCFWYGSTEPHRTYEPGIGKASGKKIEAVRVPPFLPDVPEIRSDILDYLTEIEHFDAHLLSMIRLLEKSGEFENTLIVVTGDNGMSFPGSKACTYEYGIHPPFAVSLPAVSKGGRVADDLAGFADLAPTFLEAAGVALPSDLAGRSLMPVLRGSGSGVIDPNREFAFSGRERHSHARRDNLGYPSRAVRTREFLYIRNFAPDRWPAGDPDNYYDIDGGPSTDYFKKNRDNPPFRRFAEMAMGKRPAEMLFDIRKDPGCFDNLANAAAHRSTRDRLRQRLEREMKATGDPRALGAGDIFETYPRFGGMRPHLGGFAKQGEYNNAYKK